MLAQRTRDGVEAAERADRPRRRAGRRRDPRARRDQPRHRADDERRDRGGPGAARAEHRSGGGGRARRARLPRAHEPRVELQRPPVARPRAGDRGARAGARGRARPVGLRDLPVRVPGRSSTSGRATGTPPPPTRARGLGRPAASPTTASPACRRRPSSTCGAAARTRARGSRRPGSPPAPPRSFSACAPIAAARAEAAWLAGDAAGVDAVTAETFELALRAGAGGTSASWRCGGRGPACWSSRPSRASPPTRSRSPATTAARRPSGRPSARPTSRPSPSIGADDPDALLEALAL